MLRQCINSVLRFQFAIIKSAVSPTAIKYDHFQIAQVMNVPEYPAEISEVEKMEKYIKFLGTMKGKNRLKEISINQMLQLNSRLQLVAYTKTSISKTFKTMTHEAQASINNFFAMLFINLSLISKKKCDINKSSIHWKDVVDCVNACSEFFYLMSSTIRNMILFANCCDLFRKVLGVSCYGFNFRYTIDTLMDFPINMFTNLELVLILGMMTNSNIHVYYFSRSKQIIKNFWIPLSKIWYLDQNTRRKALISFSILNFYSKDIMDRIQQLIKQRVYNEYEINSLIGSMLKFRRINHKNYPQYEDFLKQCIQDIPQKMHHFFFNMTISDFYMARVWSKAYWAKFMNFLENNKEAIELYKLYVLGQVIKAQGNSFPKELKPVFSPLEKILSSNTHFKGSEIVQDFNQKQKEEKSLSCQTQLANSLRLFNTISVRTQQLIEYFFVDIVINNKFIIEVNGATHFVTNIGEISKEKQYNLKTQFRSKMLAKLGYYVIDLDLEVFSEGSFGIVHNLYRIAHDYDFSQANQKGIVINYPEQHYERIKKQESQSTATPL